MVPGGRFSVFEPLHGESCWFGEVSEEFLALERASRRAAVDRAALREAFELEAGEIAGEYLYDLPGGVGALSILKDSFEESKIVEAVDGFARAASEGKVRGRLPCMYV